MKIQSNLSRRICRILAILLSFLLVFEQSLPAGRQVAFAQILPLANPFVADAFRPLHLRYLSYDAINNNFRLLLDKGSTKNSKPDEIATTTKQLLNYFYIGLTLPSESFWVNLRPDGEENIIDNDLARTDVGRIMLEADLQLKKDTANATSPNTPEGKAYWDKLYNKAQALFGTDNITIPTLTRVWIVPDEIILSETPTSAYIYKATLKVLLEQDYLKDSAVYSFSDPKQKALNDYSSQLFRETIIPKLNKQVNASKRYAALRQVYYSLIMAEWFKARFSDQKGLSPKGTDPNTNGTLPELINTRNLTGLTSKAPWSKTTYFQAYQKSVNEGEYNIPQLQYGLSVTSKNYVSGGVLFSFVSATRTIGDRVRVAISESAVRPFGEIPDKSDGIKPKFISVPSTHRNEAVLFSGPGFFYNIGKWLEGRKKHSKEESKLPKPEAPVKEGPDAKTVRESPAAYEFVDSAQEFRGVDLEHFVHAQVRLSHKELSREELRGLLKELGLNQELANADDLAPAYTAIYEGLSNGNYKKENIDSINGFNPKTGKSAYSDPRLNIAIIDQSGDPRSQGVYEAVSNSLDALGFKIGQFGKGVKQVIDWLEPTGGDRIDVYTRKENSQAYQLTILKDKKGQNYIQIKRIPESEFRRAAEAVAAKAIDKGTIVEITTQKEIPLQAAQSGAGENSQEAIAQGIHKLFPFITDVAIDTQVGNKAPERVNGFRKKKIIVPAGQEIYKPKAEQDNFVFVRLNSHKISIVDNGTGMDGKAFSGMFVPGGGTKPPETLSGSQAEEISKIKVVHDTSLPNRVSFSRNGRVDSIVDIPEGIHPEATLPGAGGLMLELGLFLDVPEAHNIVILKPAIEKAVMHIVNQVLKHPGLSAVDKIKYINTIVIGLDGLIKGNDNNAEVIKGLRQKIMGELSALLEELRKDNFVLLPYRQEFAKLKVPEGKKALFVHENLFLWSIETLKELGGEVVPGVKLAADKRLPLVVVPFKSEHLKGVSKFQLLWHVWTQSERIPIIKTDRFVAIPEEFGKQLAELANKRMQAAQQGEKDGLDLKEKLEFAFLLQLIKIITSDEVVTSYEVTAVKKSLSIEDLPKFEESKGRPDSPAINEFLTEPPRQVATREKAPAQKLTRAEELFYEAKELAKELKGVHYEAVITSAHFALALSRAGREDEAKALLEDLPLRLWYKRPMLFISDDEIEIAAPLAGLYKEMNESRWAIFVFKNALAAVSIKPRRPKTLVRLAQAAGELGQKKQAEELLLEAKELAETTPDSDPDMLEDLAVVLNAFADAGRAKEVEPLFKKVWEKVMEINSRAEAKGVKAEDSEAMACVEVVRAMANGFGFKEGFWLSDYTLLGMITKDMNHNIFSSLAGVYALKADAKEDKNAIGDIEEGNVDLVPPDFRPEVFAARAKAYLDLGQRDKANEYFRKALEGAKNLSDEAKARVLIHLADPAWLKSEAETEGKISAADLIEKTQKLATNVHAKLFAKTYEKTKGLLALSNILRRVGRITEADELLELINYEINYSFRRDVYNKKIRALLIEPLSEAGKEEESVKLYDKVIDKMQTEFIHRGSISPEENYFLAHIAEVVEILFKAGISDEKVSPLLDKAVQLAEGMKNKDVPKIKALMAVSQALQAVGKSDEALRLLSEADRLAVGIMNLKPKSSQLIQDLLNASLAYAKELLKANRIEEAWEKADDVVKQSLDIANLPTTPEFRPAHKLNILYAVLKGSVEMSELVSEDDIDDIEFAIGVLLSAASELLKEAATYEPTLERDIPEIARIYARTDRLEKAQELIPKIPDQMFINSSDSNLYKIRFMAIVAEELAKAGKREDADALFDNIATILAKNENWEIRISALAFIAQALAEAGMPDKAVMALNTSINLLGLPGITSDEKTEILPDIIKALEVITAKQDKQPKPAEETAKLGEREQAGLFSDTKPEDALNLLVIAPTADGRFVLLEGNGEILEIARGEEYNSTERIGNGDNYIVHNERGYLRIADRSFSIMLGKVRVVAKKGNLVVIEETKSDEKKEYTVLNVAVAMSAAPLPAIKIPYAQKVSLSASGKFSVHEDSNGNLGYYDHRGTKPEYRMISSAFEGAASHKGYRVDEKADVVILLDKFTNKYRLFSLARGEWSIAKADHIEIDSSGEVAIFKSGDKLGYEWLNTNGSKGGVTDGGNKIRVSADDKYTHLMVVRNDGYIQKIFSFNREEGRVLEQIAPHLFDIGSTDWKAAIPTRHWEEYDLEKKTIWDREEPRLRIYFPYYRLPGKYAGNSPINPVLTMTLFGNNLAIKTTMADKEEYPDLIINLDRWVDTSGNTDYLRLGLHADDRLVPLEGGKVFYTLNPRGEITSVVTMNGKVAQIKGYSFFVTADNKFIFAPDDYLLIDSNGTAVSISKQIPSGFIYSDTNGEYFVFVNPQTKEIKYLDSRKAFAQAPSKEARVSEEEQREVQKIIQEWKDKVLSKRDAFIAQAQAAYQPFLELIPVAHKTEVEKELAKQISRLYEEQDTAIRKRFQEVQEKQAEIDLEHLPFDHFATKMRRITPVLKEYIGQLMNRISQEPFEAQREILASLFTNLFEFTLHPELEIDALDANLLEIISMGWDIKTKEHIDALPVVGRLIQGFKEINPAIGIARIRKIIRFISIFTSNNPAENEDILKAQLTKILEAKVEVRKGYLERFLASFRDIGDEKLEEYLKETTVSKANQLGLAREFAIFLTHRVEHLETKERFIPEGEEKIPAGKTVHITQIMQLEGKRIKSNESVISVEELISSINNNNLPEPLKEEEKKRLLDIEAQAESGAYAREITQNSKDATKGKKGELIVDFYLQRNEQGAQEYVEEATDNGTGALYEVALLIPKSTKSEGGQIDLTGFFGTGKYTIFEGVDRQEIITKNAQRAYMFSFSVTRDSSGNPVALQLTNIRQINDSKVSQGVTVRRIKSAINTIPELDRMLAKRNWKTFAGLAQDNNFTIYFVDKEGKKEPLEVKKEVLSETDLVVPKRGEEHQTKFGRLRIISCKDMPLQIVEGGGLRVSEIKEEYLELIPASLRKHIQELGIVIQMPLLLTRSRNDFELYSYYKSYIKKYIAAEFYKAIAYKALTQTAPQFVFEGFPYDLEITDTEGYWEDVFKYREVKELARKISEGDYSSITEEELRGMLTEKDKLDKLDKYVNLIILLEVNTGAQRESLYLRRVAILENRNRKRAEEARRRLQEAGLSSQPPDVRYIPYAQEKLAQAKSIETAHEQMRHIQDFLVDPKDYTEQEKELLELARPIARHFGLEDVVLVDSSVSFAGGFISMAGKNLMALNRSIAHNIGRAAGAHIDGATDTVVHELGHLLEQLMRQDDLNEALKNGYVAHTSSYTHQSVGRFAEAMKYVAAVALYNHRNNEDASNLSPGPGTPAVSAAGAGGVVVRLSGILATAASQKEIKIEGVTIVTTLAEVLKNLPKELREQILNPDGSFKEHVIIGINGKPTTNTNEPVNPGDELSIMFGMPGGSGEGEANNTFLINTGTIEDWHKKCMLEVPDSASINLELRGSYNGDYTNDPSGLPATRRFFEKHPEFLGYRITDDMVLMPGRGKFPSVTEIPRAMADYIAWFNIQLLNILNKKKPGEKEILEFAAEAHIRFARIHPFREGNGRTAEYITNYIFSIFGYPEVKNLRIEKINYKERQINKRYSDAINESDIKALVKLIQEAWAVNKNGIDGNGISSSAEDSSKNNKVAGIDFRNLPIVSRAIDNLSVKIDSAALSNLSSLHLDTEWQKIEDLVNQGNIPSAESIKEYIQASCLNGSADKDIDKVITCIADILRIEEELYLPTEPMLLDILIAVESASSLQQIKEVFVGTQ